MRTKWAVIAGLLLALSACSSDSTESQPVSVAASEPLPTTAVGDTSPAAVPISEPSTPEPATTIGPTATSAAAAPIPPDRLEVIAYPVPVGSRPHDVAPATDGGVWYTAQGTGELGWLDPQTGQTRHISLGAGSRPHGVIVDADGVAWITDSGLNAIMSVDPVTDTVVKYPLPPEWPDANLNTAAFDGTGRLWFTGQNGIHGVLDTTSSAIEVFDSPRGRGPYGITATPLGEIYYASLAGS